MTIHQYLVQAGKDDAREASETECSWRRGAPG